EGDGPARHDEPRSRHEQKRQGVRRMRGGILAGAILAGVAGSGHQSAEAWPSSSWIAGARESSGKLEMKTLAYLPSFAELALTEDLAGSIYSALFYRF